MPDKSRQIRLRRNLTLGATSAEVDRLLESCFVHTAAYEAIADHSDHRCVIVGRSGSGKTAIVRQLQNSSRGSRTVGVIQPQSLALQFLGGSELLEAMRRTGIHLDLFYKLVWRHVLIVELIKLVFPEQSRLPGTGGLGSVLRRLGVSRAQDREREAAARYLDEWGTMFFQSGEHRIVELHDTLAKNLTARLGLGSMPTSWLSVFGVDASIEASRAKSQEYTERIQIAQQVASEIQISHLSYVVNVLHQQLQRNEGSRPYITIDDLDGVWIDSDLVYDLVRALLMEIHDLRRDLPELKVVVALRDNMLHKVERSASTGYQREKVEDQRIRLMWSAPDLTSVVDARVAHVFESQYVNHNIDHRDIFVQPRKVQNSPYDYILSRTSYRPRDLIYWINECIQSSEGKSNITLSVVRDSEGSYSDWRWKSIVDEWSPNYPMIDLLAHLFTRRPDRFALKSWTDDDILNVLTDWRIAQSPWLLELSQAVMADDPGGRAPATLARVKFCQVLYEVGAVGLVNPQTLRPQFAMRSEPELEESALNDESIVVIHRGLWQHFGIRSATDPASADMSAPTRRRAHRR